MAANNALRITNINFDEIKNNLKSFLSNQTELDDYDYESSTMQTILDLLAYNTYMNSFYVNMAGNEMFLDSAQLRESVVSRAKMLGYTPRSARGSTAVIDVTINPDDSPTNIIIPANSQFRTTIDSVNYVFTNPDLVSINANSSGVYSGRVTIKEGLPLTFRYTVSTDNPVRYIIPNENADLSTLTVKVQDSESNSSITTYTKATDLTSVTSNTAAFFVDEISENNFEIFFGDGVLGKPVRDGNIVILNYNLVNGSDTNSASDFTSLQSFDGYSDITINNIERAYGGDSYESIDSIKFNAPKGYITQNRAVTANDYRTLITNNFGDIQSVSVWGGEENNPPIYGKTYVSVKPRSSLIVSDTLEEELYEFLKTRAVLTIDPVIVDPTYLFVQPTITVRFNPNNTSATAGVLANQVQSALISHESLKLGLFRSAFIHSELIKDIDAVNDAITSVDIETKVSRRFLPNLNEKTTYRFAFNRPLFNISGGVRLSISPATHPGVGFTVTSTAFVYEGQTAYLDDDAFGNIRIYRLTDLNTRVYLNRTAGLVDYDTGLVVINDINITGYSGDFIELTVAPRDEDVRPIRNQILQFTNASVTVYDEVLGKNAAIINNIPTGGESGEVFEYGTVYSVF